MSRHARHFGDPPFFITKAPVGVGGVDLIRQAFATTEIARKGAMHDWITELGDEVKRRAWATAGPALERFGYSRTAGLSAAFPGKI